MSGPSQRNLSCYQDPHESSVKDTVRLRNVTQALMLISFVIPTLAVRIFNSEILLLESYVLSDLLVLNHSLHSKSSSKENKLLGKLVHIVNSLPISARNFLILHLHCSWIVPTDNPV